MNLSDSVTVQDITVSLSVSVPDGESGWLGDLYAYVRHDSGMSVLLNRPGRDSTQIAGYPDDQPAQLSFSDDAVNGDIHSYRLVLSGDESIPLAGPLIGLWQPDGRAVDPAQVVVDDARTAPLSSFLGSNATGNWTLFVADLSGGGEFQLDEWSVTINSASVPEPEWVGLGTALTLAVYLGIRSRSKRVSVPS